MTIEQLEKERQLVEQIRSAIVQLKEQNITLDHACYVMVSSTGLTYGACKDRLEEREKLTGLMLER